MILAVMAFAFSSYIIMDFDQFIFRAGYPNIRDLVIGNFAILLILEGTRRSIGLPLAILGLFCPGGLLSGPYFVANIPGLSISSPTGAFPLPDHRPDVSRDRREFTAFPWGSWPLLSSTLFFSESSP